MTGAERIAAERSRQILDKGYEATDAAYQDKHLVDASLAYMMQVKWEGTGQLNISDLWWPWYMSTFKPGSTIRNLEKAGALIAAEIDRLLSIEQPVETSTESSEPTEVYF